MILWISGIALLLGLFLLALLGFGKDEKLKTLGSAGPAVIVISLVFGFVIGGCLIPVSQEKSKIEKFEYVETSYSVIIDSSKGTKTFNNIRYFRANKEDFDVYYVRKYNSYGIELEDENEIKVELKE